MPRRTRQSPAKRAAKKRGAPPGSAIYVGEAHDYTVKLHAFLYGPDGVEERSEATLGELAELKADPRICWINLDGLHDVEAVRHIAELFDLHPLVVEDLLNPGTRPRVEDLGDTLFAVVKMAMPQPGGVLELEQVSVLMGSTWVLTLQERRGDLFDGVRTRIRTGNGRIRKMPSDYLMHAVLDAVVDGYFAVLDQLDERVTELEDRVLEQSAPDVPRQIHLLKDELHLLRRVVRPLRDSVAELRRSELVAPQTRPFYGDLADHVLQVGELIDGYRDRLTSVLELQLALTSQKMNDVMKVLTIVATLFIPLTFIAGIYGMNFKHMPELDWPWGYPAVMALMAVSLVAMLGVLKWKRWF